MKKIIALLLTLSACSTGQLETELSEKSIRVKVKKFSEAEIFITARDTDQRLSSVGKLVFTQGNQPLETELSIFVNPEKTFQTFVGIGGAITDASAEVFAKLPESKQ